jgi:putative membrane protein
VAEHRSRFVAQVGGAALVAATLAPPVDAAADRSLAVHMVQHVVLLVAAPPLLVFGRRHVRGAVAALAAQTAVMWGWHAPRLYDAADRTVGLHVLEHASFLAAGVAFWWTIRAARPSAALVLFLAALPGTVLGAGMTLAGHPWYATYPRLADQQLAGVLSSGTFLVASAVHAAAVFLVRPCGA